MRILIRVNAFPVTMQIRNHFLLILTTAVLAGFIGCKENSSFLGRDLLPDSDIMHVKTDTSIGISAYTITGKSITTSLNEYFPVGSLVDSIFGNTSAAIVTQYQPVFLDPPGTVTSVDSIFITLATAGSYGDSLTPQIIRVYELTEELRLDTIYYSDFDITGKYNPDELGAGVFTADDSVINIKVTNQDYFNKFFVTPDTTYENLESFVRAFKGFYIKTDPLTEKGGYARIDLGSVNSFIKVYHSGTSIFTMVCPSTVSRFNIYNHDYSTYPVKDHMDMPGSNDSLLFIEGLAGVSVRINFLGLDTFLLNKKVAINKASLIIPVDTSLTTYPLREYPSKLVLFTVKPDGSYDYLYDFRISSTYFNGTHNRTLKAFEINLSLHLQSILDKKINNSDLVLVSYTSNETPNRIILKGTGAAKPRIILKVNYTEI